jgi:2-oxoglutarate dehydrogenase E2 component (dihydrolipoamide succinyltransferase)
MIEISTPQSNVNDTEATVVEWLVDNGEQVKAGQTIITIETSKAAEEVEAPADGFLHQGVAHGDVIEVGEALGWIAETADAITEPASSNEDNIKVTPKAQALADRHGIDLSKIKLKGIITEKKIQNLIGDESSKPEPSKLIDSAHMTPLTKVQKGARKAVEHSRRNAVEAYITAEVEITQTLQLLERLVNAKNTLVTLTDLTMYRVANLLEEFPRFNATLIDDEILEYAQVNVGATVEVDGDLYVINIHDADKISLSKLAKTRQQRVLDLFRSKGDPQAQKNGTFTVTVLDEANLVHQFPIIFPDQAAILGLGATRQVLVPDGDGGTRVADKIGLTLTYDHRFLNGGMAAKFLQAICESLADVSDIGSNTIKEKPASTSEVSYISDLKKIMAPILQCEPEEIPDSAQINKFRGWDSLAQMKMVLAIEMAFKRPISNEHSMQLLTLDAFNTFLAEVPLAKDKKSIRWNGTAGSLTKYISEALLSMGVKKGETLMVHSFIGETIHIAGNAEAIIQGLQNVVGPTGTIVMPIFTTAFTNNRYLDRDNEPSETGALTEVFRNIEKVKISYHPYHRFAALGEKAAHICAEHSDTSFGPDSPMAKMHELNARIVMISTDWFPVTFFHYIEEKIDVPYRKFKTFSGTVTSNGKETEEKWRMLVRPRGSSTQLAFAEFGDRINAAQLSCGAEAGPLHLVSALMKDVYDYTVEALEEDINCLVKLE